MELYIVRHAIAEPRGAGWPDAERPLTLKGIERLERVVSGLKALDVELDAVFHSPWRRAIETAERLTPLMGRPRRVELEALAAPPGKELLRGLRGERIAAVGHEPWMGELCAWLVTGDPDLGDRFPFKKAGVAMLEGTPEPGGCALRAIWPPKTLRRLASSAR
ncbi:MAG TPA: histidine phosphatase family protein [Polyangiaceae bacterium LLY-WYZ-15_(1-7)]|nr:phosphohistidine phosphatase [Myxococcales bacterium]MAT28118.1 phosphohistidine phosphatase [Sandaracinus sp.]HJK91154.1 histidine phosphatase family protein [Polyangiaceae bacterium LLY-WYZ-15_(1-7)]MBJ71129.1 phosphohistidine phosphatase [Sandaracinus sp.]HJL01021.1 histidine phosphatase family protein [Polyangiaceae bacterium LLY-WYZ-15_(1-7)]